MPTTPVAPVAPVTLVTFVAPARRPRSTTPTGPGAPSPSRRAGRSLGPGVVALAVPAGLAAGALTSFGQTVLPGAVGGLANAVTPWLVVPFVLGAVTRRWGWALLAGVVACLGEVVGYHATSSLRGFAVSSTWVLFWLACALPAGSVASVAGWSWRRTGSADPRAPRWERGVGAAVLVAAWVGEAVVTYLVVLRYGGHAAVFGAAALLTFVVLGRHGRQHGRVALWLVPGVVVACGGFALLHG